MHDDLNHLNKTHPKNFTKTSIILKNPNFFSKTPNVRSKDMKCMINEWESIIPEVETKV